jgi:vitamin B12 transporter
MRRILLLAGILGGLAPATAQTSQDPRPPQGSQGAAATFRDTLVVTATLTEEERDELSSSLSVVGRDEVAARQASEVLELVATVPGVAAAQSGAPGKVASLFIRGANSNQTLVLWNGVALNDPFFGGFDWAHLATDGVERVEVARGPYSALWGSDAVGGVVQVLTGPDAARRLRLEGGSDGYRRASLAAGWRPGGASVDVAGHSRRGDGTQRNDFYDSDALQARWSREARPDLVLGLLARGQDAALGVPRDFAGLPSPRRRQVQESRLLAVPVTWSRGAWETATQLSWAATDLELADPLDPFAASASEAQRARARAVATWRRDAGWVAGGVEWQREEAESTSAFGGLPRRTARSRSAFAQASAALSRWRLDAGVRRDDHDAFGGETTAKAGAVYRLGENARLRASYGEGFRAPSLGDLYFPGFGNPELRPERSRSAEAALELGPRPLRLALVGFATDFDDLIQFDLATFLPQNVGRARARGLELEADWRGSSGGVRLAATYLDTEDRSTGERLPRRPERSASLVATWRPEAWTIGGTVRHVGARIDLGNLPLASYTLLELGLAFRVGEWAEPFVRIENLTAEPYEEVAGFPAPGRAWVGGVALRFGGRP